MIPTHSVMGPALLPCLVAGHQLVCLGAIRRLDSLCLRVYSLRQVLRRRVNENHVDSRVNIAAGMISRVLSNRLMDQDHCFMVTNIAIDRESISYKFLECRSSAEGGDSKRSVRV
ncbi:hypothetical protein C8R42DRAFT_691901 [Lentinula raphanica]|nr:hypothetical protein C8R42DRAFT_691901 [Lentinula raphanica]